MLSTFNGSFERIRQSYPTSSSNTEGDFGRKQLLLFVSNGDGVKSSSSYMAGCFQLAATFIGYDVDVFVFLGLEEAKLSLYQRIRHVGKIFELFQLRWVVQITLENLNGRAIDTFARDAHVRIYPMRSAVFKLVEDSPKR